MKIILLILTVTFLVVACIAPRPTPTVSPISPLAQPTSTPIPTRTPVVIVSGNLLLDPSLEGPYRSDGVHGEINTSIYWTAWESCGGSQGTCAPPCLPGKPDCDLPCPSNCTKPDGKCQSDFGCYWQRQEFNPFNFDKAPYRVRSGDMSQVIFSYGRMALGGIQQTVAITPGTWLKFTAWMQAWMCYSYPQCDGGRRSDQPSDMQLRVGIDPTGGVMPTSTNVVWSPGQEAFDRWVQFSVVARSVSDTVTVFTSGGAVWDWARSNNDQYLDDLALVAIAPMTNTVFLPAVMR